METKKRIGATSLHSGYEQYVSHARIEQKQMRKTSCNNDCRRTYVRNTQHTHTHTTQDTLYRTHESGVYLAHVLVWNFRKIQLLQIMLVDPDEREPARFERCVHVRCAHGFSFSRHSSFDFCLFLPDN